jgi:hypothetical protein
VDGVFRESHAAAEAARLEAERTRRIEEMARKDVV